MKEAKKKKPGYNTVSPDLYGILKDYVQEQRKYPTDAESLLWEYLKGKATGYKFRRQHAIGDYIADFVCLSERLIIEVDGNVHDSPENKEHDKVRTTALNAMGYDVLRYTNEEVMTSAEDVVESIVNYIEQ